MNNPYRRPLFLLIPHHTVLWLGRVFALLVMVLVGFVSGGIWWLQQFHPAGKPVDLSGLAPRLEKMLGPGASLTLGGLDLYYDRGIVLRGDNLWVKGPDGALAVLVEEASVRFSGMSLWRLKIAPRSIEARKVTLRLVRSDGSLSIAGLNVRGAGAAGGGVSSLGVVAWLNGLGGNEVWGWLKNVRVADLTLLMQDDVQHTEWIVQDANLDIGRADDEGEHGSLVAEVRRVDADGSERRVPMLLTFDHRDGADSAELRARFGSADMDLIAGYLPKAITDMMTADGTVEMGTKLDRDNRLGQPWITLTLRDVVFAPPPDFSHQLKFPRLKLTASYQPSPTDLLTLHDVEATYKGIEPLHAKGWVQGVTSGDPLASVVIYSAGGEAQRFFDFMPDKRLDVAMPFLRKNISADAKLANVVLSYSARPSTLPFCGDNCGLVIRAKMVKGQARFADELPPMANVSGTVELVGDNLNFVVAPSTIGPQKASDVHVTLSHLFVPGPTYLMVSGTIAGPLPDLLKNLGNWMKEPMPEVSEGTHVTGISFTLPFVRGKQTDFADAMVDVASTVADVELKKIPSTGGGLDLPPMSLKEGTVKISHDVMIVEAAGKMDGQSLSAALTDKLASFGDNLKGEVVWSNPSDAKLVMDGNRMTLTGKKLDLTSYDLAEMGKGDSKPKDMNVAVKLDTLLTREARLDGVNAQLAARDGRWQIDTFIARLDGGAVSVQTVPTADKRRKLTVNIENTGKLLRALGLYQDLRNGHLTGEMNYDNPDIASGVLEMKKFELQNPPVLVRLLGLLSLTQLIAGTDGTLFDKGIFPLRFDHDMVFLDNVVLEGPSMSLRLNGSYNRASKVLDVAGQLAPAIPFNRLVGKIPLLGTLLTGSQEGVVVADFSLKGNSDAPDISVHPLSIITPGLLKDLFSGITGGNKPAAKPQIIDGRSKKK